MPGSVVGIATAYGLDGPGIESRWGRDFPRLSRPHVQWVPGLSRDKERPRRDADPSPLLVPWSRKSRAIPLLPLWAVRPVQSLSRAIPLLPLWTVRPVQSLSRAIPLLPLWTVRPVQSLSRAIRLLPLWTVRPVQSLSRAMLYFPYGPNGLYRASVELYLYSPYGPYGMYRASMNVQRCTLPLYLYKHLFSTLHRIECVFVSISKS